MKPLDELNRYQVGLLGIGAAAFLVAGIGSFAEFEVGSTTYVAEMEHTGGLRPGEEVQVAGVGVGEVKAIELAEESVQVTFTVDSDIDLGADTEAEVKVATLLGTHFLMVSPEGEGELEDGTIPLARTAVPFNLQDVLDTATPELDAFDTATIDAALQEVATTLDASGGELGPALDGVSELSTVIARRSEDLDALLGAAEDVTAQLRDSSGDIVELVDQATLILDTLVVRREAIHALLRDLSTLGEELAGVVDDTRADFRPMLRDLGTVITVLRQQEGNLDRTIATLAPATRYFTNASGTGPWLDQHVPGALPDNLQCTLRRIC